MPQGHSGHPRAQTRDRLIVPVPFSPVSTPRPSHSSVLLAAVDTEIKQNGLKTEFEARALPFSDEKHRLRSPRNSYAQALGAGIETTHLQTSKKIRLGIPGCPTNTIKDINGHPWINTSNSRIILKIFIAINPWTSVEIVGNANLHVIPLRDAKKVAILVLLRRLSTNAHRVGIPIVEGVPAPPVWQEQTGESPYIGTMWSSAKGIRANVDHESEKNRGGCQP